MALGWPEPNENIETTMVWGRTLDIMVPKNRLLQFPLNDTNKNIQVVKGCCNDNFFLILTIYLIKCSIGLWGQAFSFIKYT